GTTVGGPTDGSGGSYGGLGGNGIGVANALYGSETMPVDLGSGAAALGNQLGGNGGGRIEVEARDIEIRGQMLSDWGGGLDDGGGGGSGGSIYLRVMGGTFFGDGVVRASGGVPRGGVPGRSGAGGGGRIAIVGHTNNTFAGTSGRAGSIFVQGLGSNGSLSL